MGSDKSFLVTGAGGQVGLALSRLVPERIHLSRVALDVTDRPAVFDAVLTHRPEVIINAAAYTGVDEAEGDQDAAHQVNVHAVRYLADAASQVNALLVHISTDYVFSGEEEGPYVEDDPTDPKSVYGRTKLEGEREAASATRHLIVRTSWVFGEGRNFIRSILGGATHRNFQDIEVVDDQRGMPTYAVDLARGILDLVSADATGTYHLAGGGAPTTWAGLAEWVMQVAGKKTRVKGVTTKEYFSGRKGPHAPRPANSVLDCSKAASLGVVLPDWKDAVRRYLDSMGQA